MSNIWITADTHFNHVNICGPKISNWESGYRNFDTLYQMNGTIIDNINSLVKEDDVLYHLGDFAMGQRKYVADLRNKLQCKTIHLIRGNHDNVKRIPEGTFASIEHYCEVRVGKLLVCMSHYPFASWNEVGRGSIQLHGHCHGSYEARGRQLDVGMDCHVFHPLALEDIVKDMKEKPVKTVDHHNKQTSYH